MKPLKHVQTYEVGPFEDWRDALREITKIPAVSDDLLLLVGVYFNADREAFYITATVENYTETKEDA